MCISIKAFYFAIVVSVAPKGRKKNTAVTRGYLAKISQLSTTLMLLALSFNDPRH